MNQALVRCLNDVGQATGVYQSPDGSRLLILAHGGRVLGLYAPGSGENFYWTHPALDSPGTARTFYASDAWHNSGGDRTWLAPELDLFYPDYPDLKRYHQPRQLDPGHYEMTADADGIRLVNRLAVAPARSGQTVALELGKAFAPAANPLRHEREAGELLKLEYAGYTQHTWLAAEGEVSARIGAWNLIQLPHGGDLLVPIQARTRPKVYFGAVPPSDLEAGDRLIRYRMRADGVHKIGVRAVAATGRAGYLYSSGGRSALVIRNFFVNPSGEYVDVPVADPDDPGYAVQACNVMHEGLGAFSELEYHVPASGPGPGRSRCDDWSQVWAFRGPAPLILAAARALLSPDA